MIGVSILFQNTSIFQKIEVGGTFPYFFYETRITIISRPEKDIMRMENYRPVSLINIDAKILPKC